MAIFTDTFNDLAGTPLPTHNAAWTARLGTFLIQSNRAQLATLASSEAHATIDAGQADYVAECVVTMLSGDTAGLVVRWASTTSFYLIGAAPGTGLLLFERTAGGYVLRASISATISAGVDYTIRATVSGSTIVATLDGAHQISYASATTNPASTICGIRSNKIGSAIDNFQVAATAAGLIVFPTPDRSPLTTVYAGPGGSNDDETTPTIAAPWSLQNALSSSRVAVGATIWLLAGTHQRNLTHSDWTVIDFTATITGPVTLKPLIIGTVIVDGGFKVTGSDITIQSIEFLYSGWISRQSAFNSLTPSDMPYIKTFEIRGPRTTIINCVMHDLAECELWEVAPDSTIYGCVVYNNGFNQLSNGGVGHALYTQNDTGTPLLKHNVVVSAYNFGIHAYGSSAANLNNYQIIENIHTNVRMLIGGLGSSVVRNVLIDANYLYQSQLNVGYNAAHNSDAVITDNIIGGTNDPKCQIFKLEAAITFRRNIIYHNSAGVVVEYSPSGAPVVDWDANEYHYGGAGTNSFTVIGTGNLTYAQWKAATGFDSTSTYDTSAPSDRVVALPNAYGGAHRGSVAIYNWSGAAHVSVDLSSLGLDIGAIYDLKNAANYYAEKMRFRYNGDLLTVPMTGWTVAVPIAAAAALFSSTFPTFGAFVVTLVSPSAASLPYEGDLTIYDFDSPTGSVIGSTILPSDAIYA